MWLKLLAFKLICSWNLWWTCFNSCSFYKSNSYSFFKLDTTYSSSFCTHGFRLCLTLSHNQTEFDARARSCIFINYPSFISRDVFSMKKISIFTYLFFLFYWSLSSSYCLYNLIVLILLHLHHFIMFFPYLQSLLFIPFGHPPSVRSLPRKSSKDQTI